MTQARNGPTLSSAALRRAFGEFFEARGHLAPPPASLVPAGDPSVLFTTAGMQQFKPYYLGVDTPPAARLTTCQRCFRTSDIENVGRTARHLTFFEMLGNFSIGDYFKREAIAWALEFSDQIGDRPGARQGQRVRRRRAGARRRRSDRHLEVARLHRRRHRASRARRQLLGAGRTDGPLRALHRAVLRHGRGARLRTARLRPRLRVRPLDGVLEPRLRAVRDGRTGRPLAAGRAEHRHRHGTRARQPRSTRACVTVYETDAFRPLIELGEQLSGATYGESEVVTRALRIIAEHSRGIAFLIMDGVLPGNEGRDYVLRRIIRRAVQQGVAIGLDEPFLARLCERVVELMGEAYPALVASREAIVEIVGEEEARFTHTLTQGLGILDEALRRARDSGAELPPAVAFELHDTYGFPFDLTREIVQDRGMSVDEAGFERLMAEQRQRARTAQRAGESGPGELEAFQRDTAALDDDLRRLRAPRGLHHGARRARPCRRARGAQARGVAVLCRGRRSGRRHRLDPHRLRQARRDRRRALRERSGDRRPPDRGQHRGGRARQGHGQRRAAPSDGLQPHRHAPAAQRPARSCSATRCARRARS